MADLNVTAITDHTIEADDYVYGFSSSTSKAPTVETLVTAAPGVSAIGVCDTAAATAAKVVTCANWNGLAGQSILITFTYANTASNPTLNINGKGALPIYNGSTREEYIPEGNMLLIVNSDCTKLQVVESVSKQSGDTNVLGAFQTHKSNLNISNLDNLIVPGVYSVNLSAAAPKVGSGTLYVSKYIGATSTEITQVFIHYSNQIYTRIKSSNAWTDWSLLINKNTLDSTISKTDYYGTKTIDIVYSGKMAIIYSSTFASSAMLVVLLNNYNILGIKLELAKQGNISVSNFTHVSDGIDRITVSAPDGYKWTLMYI